MKMGFVKTWIWDIESTNKMKNQNCVNTMIIHEEIRFRKMTNIYKICYVVHLLKKKLKKFEDSIFFF